MKAFVFFAVVTLLLTACGGANVASLSDTAIGEAADASADAKAEAKAEAQTFGDPPPAVDAGAEATADASADVAIEASSPDSSVDVAPTPMCCRLTYDNSVVTCGGAQTWNCCPGPQVNCDGGWCTGFCSAHVVYACQVPSCAPGQTCRLDNGAAGVVEVCP
jgi:hypothetical protein